MADVITSAVAVNTSARIVTSYGELAPSYNNFKNSFANGTGSNQADRVCFIEFTVPASGSYTLNLSDSSLHQPNGAAFAPVKLKEISAYNTDATSKVTVGVGTQPFTPWLAGTAPTEDLMPGGLMVHTCPLAGWTVAAGTSDRINFTNASGAGVVVQVKLTGTSA